MKNEIDAIPHRVANGVDWLDKALPNWHKNINCDTLFVGDDCDCIIGQLFGDFNVSHEDLLTDNQILDYGFHITESSDCTGDEADEYYIQLTDEWVRAINLIHTKEKELEMA